MTYERCVRCRRFYLIPQCWTYWLCGCGTLHQMRLDFGAREAYKESGPGRCSTGPNRYPWAQHGRPTRHSQYTASPSVMKPHP